MTPRIFLRRRLVLAAMAAAALSLAACVAPAEPPTQVVPSISAGPGGAAADDAFERLETEFGARLGVYAVDTGTAETVEFRADERFAFASTYKALAVGAVLEQSTLAELDEPIAIEADDLVDYSPITEGAVGVGMTLGEVAVAAIQHSDNTAGNLLLDRLGGPEGFDDALARHGDVVTVAEREETSLNDYVPGDDRDTSTPRALASGLASFALGDALDVEKRNLFGRWLKGNTTGDGLIRAGVPAGWEVGDKTGAAAYGTRNDIAVLWRPDGAPIAVAILSDRNERDAEYDDELIAEAARVAVDALTS